MTKTTKIFAGLGVATALGVAALPALTTFAADPQSVTGNVDLYVNVPEAIAMTITGNNDAETQLYVTDPVTTGVDQFLPASGQPSTVDGHPRPETQTAASSSYTSLTQNTVSNDATFISTIKVYTNAASGYTLTAKDKGTATMINQTNNDATIPAVGTVESKVATGEGSTDKNDVMAGEAAWGYKVDSGDTWLAMPASTAENAATIKEKGSATSNGEETIVHYGISTAADQASGVYKDTIVYTATTK